MPEFFLVSCVQVLLNVSPVSRAQHSKAKNSFTSPCLPIAISRTNLLITKTLKSYWVQSFLHLASSEYVTYPISQSINIIFYFSLLLKYNLCSVMHINIKCTGWWVFTYVCTCANYSDQNMEYFQLCSTFQLISTFVPGGNHHFDLYSHRLILSVLNFM